ncbi:MAG TPA: hypothetical protein VNP04_10550 [Alphaproteobacteria bacterium]|nr:hypothetical protein [Alphaproteobacteria bacterium]
MVVQLESTARLAFCRDRHTQGDRRDRPDPPSIANDRLVPPEQSVLLCAFAKRPQRLVILEGYGHHEAYIEPAFTAARAVTPE